MYFMFSSSFFKNKICFSGFHLSGIVAAPKSSSNSTHPSYSDSDKRCRVSITFDRYIFLSLNNFFLNFKLP